MGKSIVLRALRGVAVLALPVIVIAVCWGETTAWMRPGRQAGESLHMAAFAGDFTRARTLLDAGEHPDRRDEYGATALAYAAYGGHTEIVSLLVARGATVGPQALQGPVGRTALHWAAMGGSRHTVKQLLDQGEDVNASDRDGETPLHLAAQFGNAEAYELLANRGANRAAKNGDGRTPLDVAAAGERDDVREVAGVELQ